MHPTRRQISAGKPYSTFLNIWDLLICTILRCIIIYAFHPNEPHFHRNCIGISIFLYGLSWHIKAHWQRFCDFQDRFAYLLTEMGQAVPTEEDFNKADLVIFYGLIFLNALPWFSEPISSYFAILLQFQNSKLFHHDFLSTPGLGWDSEVWRVGRLATQRLRWME